MTTIPKAITFTGTIHADEAMTIAGTVTGDVHASNPDVTLETGAHVDGAVTGRTITIRGQSSGRLIARELVWMDDTARVRADIASPTLISRRRRDLQRIRRTGRIDAALIVAAYRGRTEPSRIA